ncbi:MAG: hypothetical protein ABI130_09410 [Leifsonia sp.]
MTPEAYEPDDDDNDDNVPPENQNADDAEDPELDALWSMSIDQLQEIIDDDSHPLQAKAKLVAAEAMKPITDAVKEITKSMTVGLDFSKSIGRMNLKGLVPVIDTTSWAAKFMPTIHLYTVPQGLRDSNETAKQLTQPAPITVDFDSIRVPTASVREVEVAAEERAHQLRKDQLQVMTDLLAETRTNSQAGEEALEVSKNALKSAKSSARAAWIAAWVAIGSVVVTLAGIGVTALLSH